MASISLILSLTIWMENSRNTDSCKVLRGTNCMSFSNTRSKTSGELTFNATYHAGVYAVVINIDRL